MKQKILYCPVCETENKTDYWESLEMGRVRIEYRCLIHHILLKVEKGEIPQSINNLEKRLKAS